MTNLDDLNEILNRVAARTHTEADLYVLRNELSGERGHLQVGKYAVNITEGQDIRIGDTITISLDQHTDAKTLHDILYTLLQEKQASSDRLPASLPTWSYLHTLRGHAKAVNAVAISADGKTLVSGGSDRILNIWQFESMQLRHTLPKGYTSVQALAISPDGQTLVSGSKGGTVKVWRLATGAQHYALDRVHPGGVTSVAISNDAQWLISAGGDRTIRIGELATGKLVKTLQAGQTPVRAIALSPDDQWLIGGSEGGTLRRWHMETGSLHRRPILAHQGAAINAVMVDMDRQTVITASADTSIKLWGWEDGALLHTLEPGQTAVNTMAIGDGTLVSGSGGGTVKFWNVQTQELLYALHGIHFSAINAIALSPDGQRCVTGSAGGNLKVWQKKG